MITVEFKDLNDMVEFAKRLADFGTENRTVQDTPVAPTVSVQQPPVQQAPVQQPVSTQSAPVQQPAPTVPTSSINYTLDDLARAAMTIMDSGRQGDLVGLLAQFGVEALPALPKEQYGAFATALRGWGAQI